MKSATSVFVLEETPELADERDKVDGGDKAQHVGHGAETFGRSRMTHVDVALSSQSDRQPHRSRVKYSERDFAPGKASPKNYLFVTSDR